MSKPPKKLTANWDIESDDLEAMLRPPPKPVNEMTKEEEADEIVRRLKQTPEERKKEQEAFARAIYEEIAEKIAKEIQEEIDNEMIQKLQKIAIDIERKRKNEGIVSRIWRHWC